MQDFSLGKHITSAPYTKFAYYYDLLGWSEFAETMYPMLINFFDKLTKTPANFLDLACGTGTLAYKLAEQKIRVTGIDISREMIKIAAAKRSLDQYQPIFRYGDITAFDLGRQFDCVGCFFDSLNHLKTREDIKKTFQRAYDHLYPQSWFIFDMITRFGFENWQDYYNSVEDSFYVSQEAKYIPEEDYARVKIEAFVKDDTAGSVHIKEVFNEIHLPLKSINEYLSEVGFTKIIIRPYPPAETLDDADRVVIYARK